MQSRRSSPPRSATPPASQPTSRADPQRRRADSRRDWAHRRRESRGPPARPRSLARCRAGRARRPTPDLDDLVIELHPPTPAHDHVQLFLLLMRVPVREAIVGRDALVAKAALLELERLACVAELQARGAVEVGPEILQILLEVGERERHGRDPTVQALPRNEPECPHGPWRIP